MIYLGSDHGGFELKEKIKAFLMEKGEEVEDLGAETLDPGDDFVDYAVEVAEMVAGNPDALGIVFCRNGVGVDITVNRFPGMRSVLGFDEGQVEKARTDDDVNCLSLPADYIDLDKAKRLVNKFLETKFDGGERFVRRLIKLESIAIDDGCGGGCGGCGGGGCGSGCC